MVGMIKEEHRAWQGGVKREAGAGLSLAGVPL